MIFVNMIAHDSHTNTFLEDTRPKGTGNSS